MCNLVHSTYITEAVRWFGLSTRSCSKVGFIGLGNMGAHMAGYVLKGGHRLVVYDTRPEALRPFILADAEVVTSPAELASKVDRIVTMIPTPEDVLEVYLGKNGLISGGEARAGSILIDSSTTDPATSQQVARAAQHERLHFVDAPVTGAVPAARAGTLTFLFGGELTILNQIRELLLTMGSNVIHCGSEIGSGQVAKLCNNMLLAITMIGTSETLNLGARLGLDPKLLTEILNQSSGKSWVSESYNPIPGLGDSSLPASNQYQGGFGCKLMAKDLNLAQRMAVHSHTPTPMGSLALQIYRMMTNNGCEDKDFSYPYQFLRQTKEDS